MASIMMHLPHTKGDEIHRSNQLHLHHEIQQGGGFFGSIAKGFKGAVKGVTKVAKGVGKVAKKAVNVVGDASGLVSSAVCIAQPELCPLAKAAATEAQTIQSSVNALTGSGIHRHQSRPPPRPGQYRMDSRVLGGGHH
jgi:hypothetical protein